MAPPSIPSGIRGFLWPPPGRGTAACSPPRLCDYGQVSGAVLTEIACYFVLRSFERENVHEKPLLLSQESPNPCPTTPMPQQGK